MTSYYCRKTIIINEKAVNLSLWDSGGGQEPLRRMKELFVKDSDIFILIYFITKENTYKGVYYWVNKIKEISEKEFIIGILGNGTDLIEKVEDNEMFNYAKSIGAKIKYVSAKEKSGIILNFLKELVLDYLKRRNILNQKDYENEIRKNKNKEKEILLKLNKRYKNNKNYVKLLTKFYNY